MKRATVPHALVNAPVAAPVAAPPGPGIFFDDVQAGHSWTTPGAPVGEDEIVHFAGVWDPQPQHLDREAAAATVFGQLCASGLHTLLLTYRLHSPIAACWHCGWPRTTRTASW